VAYRGCRLPNDRRGPSKDCAPKIVASLPRIDPRVEPIVDQADGDRKKSAGLYRPGSTLEQQLHVLTAWPQPGRLSLGHAGNMR